MAYSELIKDFSRIRDYMREFFVYGFKNRGEIGQKSTRSYDNERRRIESWLSDCIAFRQDVSGKAVFLSMDSRHIPHNPMHKAWKAASFTKNDIGLHFLILDILSKDKIKTTPEILDIIDQEYMPFSPKLNPIDESTLRKKLKEYVDLGVITVKKQGRQLGYRLSDDHIGIETWQTAIAFFSEENPLGVVGSFLLNKFDSLMPKQDIFSFKHHYLLFTLDSGVMLDLLSAIHEHRKVEIKLFEQRGNRPRHTITLPIKIFISTQGGRQYLAGFNMHTKKPRFFRLDSIQSVKPLDIVPDFDTYKESLRNEQAHIWGVATSNGQVEHIEMILYIAPTDIHIVHRLEREKRCGNVEQLAQNTWRFIADVYDAQELLPWLRTFIGRIVSLNCSNKIVEERFWSDFALLTEMYGGDDNAV